MQRRAEAVHAARLEAESRAKEGAAAAVRESQVAIDEAGKALTQARAFEQAEREHALDATKEAEAFARRAAAEREEAEACRERARVADEAEAASRTRIAAEQEVARAEASRTGDERRAGEAARARLEALRLAQQETAAAERAAIEASEQAARVAANAQALRDAERQRAQAAAQEADALARQAQAERCEAEAALERARLIDEIPPAAPVPAPVVSIDSARRAPRRWRIAAAIAALALTAALAPRLIDSPSDAGPVLASAIPLPEANAQEAPAREEAIDPPALRLSTRLGSAGE